MKRLLTLFYLLSPLWIFPLIGLVFNFNPMDILALVGISQIFVFIFLFIAHRVKAQFKFLRKSVHLTGIIIILTLLQLNIQRMLIFFSVFLLFLLSLPLHFYPEKFHYILRDLVTRTKRKTEKRSLRCVVHFLIAALILLLFFPFKAIKIGLLVTLVGDPFSYFIGKHFGKRKLFREKTLEGFLAFFFSSFSVLFVLYGNFSVILIALYGGLVELLTGKWVDDNASIPITVSSLAWIINF